MSRERRWLARHFAGAGLPVLALMAACAGTESQLPPAAHVILVAVDGADWQVIDPLIAEGRLPGFERLKRDGAYGVLSSQEPLFSPVVWATVATGKPPESHGIESFTVEYEGRRVPVTSNLFRVPRLWEMLSDRGRTVGVVGWWASWPATPVNGFLVSERAWPLTMGERGWPVTTAAQRPVTHRTYPEGLFDRIEPLIVTRDELTAEDLERVDVSGALATLGGEGPSAADMYAKDLSFARIARSLYSEHRPEFFSVYLELTDVMAHYFWEFWRYYRYTEHGEATEFTEPPLGLPEATARQVGRNFEGAYVLADEVLRSLMELADDSTLVIVVSDHGYGENAGGRRLHVGDNLYSASPHWHRLEGILGAWGYGVAHARRIDSAGVLDVAPTVLYALGEPVGADMPGRVLTDLFAPAFGWRPPATVPTYDGLVERPATPLPSPDDDEQLELLRSLGYVR